MSCLLASRDAPAAVFTDGRGRAGDCRIGGSASQARSSGQSCQQGCSSRGTRKNKRRRRSDKLRGLGGSRAVLRNVCHVAEVADECDIIAIVDGVDFVTEDNHENGIAVTLDIIDPNPGAKASRK